VQVLRARWDKGLRTVKDQPELMKEILDEILWKYKDEPDFRDITATKVIEYLENKRKALNMKLKKSGQAATPAKPSAQVQPAGVNPMAPLV